MPCCELTGKRPVVKNLVSHSNIKTKSRAHANIQKKQMFSSALKQNFRLRVAVSTLRTIEHRGGGFDAFILKQADDCLSPQALKIKNSIRRKLQIKKPQRAS